MRVLLVTHQAPPHIGGIENLVLAEANALLAAGHDVTWITSDGTGDGQEPPAHARLRLVRVRAWHGIERRHRIAFPLFAPTLVWHLWREVRRADVVHVHGLVYPASVVAACFARLRGKWSICTDHGGLLRYPSHILTWTLRALFATAGRLTAHACDRLIALNTENERLLARLAGDATKVRLVPNPVDTTVWRPPTPAERAAARASLGWDERPRVLCVARLLPHKGIDVLLAAQHPSWVLVFCGPGEDDVRERLRAGGAECLLPRPQLELRALYHAADLFALPSHNEGFPLVVQEAIACGLPVLTSDAPAYEPYRGTPGLHLCTPSAAEVAAALRALLAQPREHVAPRGPLGVDAAVWVRDTTTPAARRVPRGPLVVAALVLLLVHVAVAALRLPGKVWGRRLDDIAAYRASPAGFLLDGAKLTGGAELAWLLREAPADAVVLWRWPCDGAVEFAPALLTPRWCVDERAVPAGATGYMGRPLARGALRDGTRGTFVVTGTANGGLELKVREP